MAISTFRSVQRTVGTPRSPPESGSRALNATNAMARVLANVKQPQSPPLKRSTTRSWPLRKGIVVTIYMSGPVPREPNARCSSTPKCSGSIFTTNREKR